MINVKKIIILLLIPSFLVACKNDTLDTSKLVVEEQKLTGDAPEGFEFPYISYIAPSLEAALEAIPFEVTLPNKLPFDAKPFKPMILRDWSKDGKQIEIELWTVSDSEEEIGNNTGTGKGFIINARNFEMNGPVQQGKEAVTITKNIKGMYDNSSVPSLSFEVDGIYYLISFSMGKMENSKKELLKIAKQMF
ncbi:hypothetical protein HNQ94_000952 [Salirhabdus euzebyi]|uniref:Lipoprotein n=1 Tax=Salirhabdus euzebyi TaxID=394506 RepID=A0A841PU41_9BACI|nr:hypothetical protein [Salirhabdus euzebyi]MBB6452507.1 hypothetical protein [Salirhabdus euzebyi]